VGLVWKWRKNRQKPAPKITANSRENAYQDNYDTIIVAKKMTIIEEIHELSQYAS